MLKILIQPVNFNPINNRIKKQSYERQYKELQQFRQSRGKY
jgi:hypothetical protein